MILDTACWWGGVWYLEVRLAKVEAETGCQISSQHHHKGGWPIAARLTLLAPVMICPVGSNSRVVFASDRMRVEGVPWAPVSVRLWLEGSQSIGQTAADNTFRLLAKRDGAPFGLFLPLRSQNGQGVVKFQSAFAHFQTQLGIASRYPVTVKNLAGRVVWNRRATDQASALAVSASADQARVAPMADSLSQVSVVVSVPGPFPKANVMALLGAVLLPDLVHNAGVADDQADAVTQKQINPPSVLVQRLAARWRGIDFSWSARLLAAQTGLTGESWLTLTNWRTLLKTLADDKTLTPQQTVFLNRLSDELSQRFSQFDAPIAFPLPVRNGSIMLGGVSGTALLGVLRSGQPSSALLPVFQRGARTLSGAPPAP
ncbi:hypothetical protein [Acetobacter indonesiensis]|uniref:hypothetical protein n=1 Tax=Acetobacter indonesiensis TaxID=104101 RepID=UPI0039EAE0F3